MIDRLQPRKIPDLNAPLPNVVASHEEQPLEIGVPGLDRIHERDIPGLSAPFIALLKIFDSTLEKAMRIGIDIRSSDKGLTGLDFSVMGELLKEESKALFTLITQVKEKNKSFLNSSEGKAWLRLVRTKMKLNFYSERCAAKVVGVHGIREEDDSLFVNLSLVTKIFNLIMQNIHLPREFIEARKEILGIANPLEEGNEAEFDLTMSELIFVVTLMDFNELYTTATEDRERIALLSIRERDLEDFIKKFNGDQDPRTQALIAITKIIHEHTQSMLDPSHGIQHQNSQLKLADILVNEQNPIPISILVATYIIDNLPSIFPNL